MKKTEIIRTVSEAAKKYNELFNAQNTYVVYGALNNPVNFETKALPENFLHLTGLEVNESHILRDVSNKNQKANEVFFEKALHGKLVEDDFEIKNDSTEEKLSVLVNALDITADNRKVGNLNNPHTKLEADILIGNGAACLGFVRAGKNYIPKTVLKSSINKETCENFSSVHAILNKRVAEKEYNKILFASRKVDLEKLLEKFKDDIQISPNLMTQLSTSVNKADITIKTTLNDLKNIRQNLIKGKNKAQKSQAKRDYREKIESLKNKDVYTIDMLLEIVNELKNRSVIAKEKSKQIMKENIEDINNVIKLRQEIEKNSPTLKDISSPTSALSSVSSTLIGNFGNDLNNTQNFSIESQQRQQYGIATPILVGQAAGVVALSRSIPPPSMFDLNRITAALEALNEKITDVLHNISSSFKRSHEQSQEKPQQAPTTHEKKNTYGLPFPKKEPSEERTEPSAAKPEKTVKRETKSAEKQSSWIGKQISSAKREADANNKTHEVKHHNKDQSL